MRHGWVLALALGSTVASADEVYLRNGGRLVGEVRERRPDAVVLETGPGLITVPLAQVARIVTTSSALASYRARAARLRDDDAEGWFDLALWARDQGLNTQARQALDHVLALNPNHSGAHQAAGHLLHDGRWMTPDESYRARGFVPFEGSWVTPADRDAMLVERAAASEERRQRAEADARVREAEARARAAEAEARRAEAEAQAQGEGSGGIPYPWVLGGGAPVIVVGGQPVVVNPQPLPPPPPPVVRVTTPPQRQPRRDRPDDPRSRPMRQPPGAVKVRQLEH
jgi:hypothetical protein